MTLPIDDLSIFISRRNSRLLGGDSRLDAQRISETTSRQLWRQKFRSMWTMRLLTA